MKKFVAMFTMLMMFCTFATAYAMESYDIHQVWYSYDSFWGFKTYESYYEDEFKTSFDKSTMLDILSGKIEWMFETEINIDAFHCVVREGDYIGAMAWNNSNGYIDFEFLVMTII